MQRDMQRTQTEGYGHGQHDEGEHKIPLNGTLVGGSKDSDYLGLSMYTGRVFICKYPTEQDSKGKAALIMMTAKKWFSLILAPKFLSNLYDTHVSSLILHGS